MNFRVDSIIVGGGRKLAVINGQRATIGETVQGARVVGIESDSVSIAVDGVYKRIAISKPLQKKWIRRDKR